MKTVLSLILAALVSFTPALNLIGVGPTPAAAQSPAHGGLTIPTSTTGPATLNITRFAVQNGQVVGIGTVTGIGDTGNVVIAQVVVPVITGAQAGAAITATCDILHLVLGPLDLDLLGLHVHLNQIVLDITAQSGPGNLLGNLLCAITNLLNGTGPLGQLAALLNQLIDLLNSL